MKLKCPIDFEIPINLDDKLTRDWFLARFGGASNRAIAFRLGLRGRGVCRPAGLLRNYAWSARKAESCRLKEQIDDALRYEYIMEKIYIMLPKEYIW